MSKPFKITLNRAGVRQLLRSEGTANMILAKADEIKARCGEGYESSTMLMGSRQTATVHAKSVEAKKDNSVNNTLQKNLY